MHKLILFCMLLFCLGCQLDPIPKDIVVLHKEAQEQYKLIKPLVHRGDIVFRMGSTPLLSGLLDFSQWIGRLTNSDFSHACMVVDVDDDILLVDIVPTGITRVYFRDWHINGPTKNLVIKRLKPEFQYLIPDATDKINALIDRDILYDPTFAEIPQGAEMFKGYCTQMVDYAFRSIGHPLADPMRIKDFPGYDIPTAIGCIIGGIDSNSRGVFVGNDDIGLFSSHMLETVIDTRN